MAETTFRDFAGAIMGNDTARAAAVLAELMGLDASASEAAVAHFSASMKADPSFMMKATGLRTAVTGGTDAEIAALLGDCFGLTSAQVGPAVATLRARYPASQA